MFNLLSKLSTNIYELGSNIFISKLKEINLDIFFNFLWENKYIYLFILITYILLSFDDKFDNNKWKYMVLFIIFILIILMTITVIIINVKDLPKWLNELFWYSKILNLSVIIHVIWLPFIYKIFWYLKCEKICWIISRISFIFSSSFILFVLTYIDMCVYVNINRISLDIIMDENIDSETGMDLYNYYEKIYHIISTILCIIRTIVAFFIILFYKYVALIFGIRDLYKIPLKNWIYMLLFFMSTLIISYWILGIARLYIVWIIIFFYNLYLLFKVHINLYGNDDPNNIYNIKLSEITYRKIFIDFFNLYLLSYYKYDVEYKQKEALYFLYRNLFLIAYSLPQVHYLYLNERNPIHFKAICWKKLFIFDYWVILAFIALWNMWIEDRSYNFKKIRGIVKLYKNLKIIYNLNEKEKIFLKEIYIRNICLLKKKGLKYSEIKKLYIDNGYMPSEDRPS